MSHHAHHASCIKHHASCIIHHASCIMHHASDITHHASCIMHHAWPKEDDLKNEDDLKKEDDPLTVTATPQLMSNRICYQVSKPEMEFHMMNIIYAKLPMPTQTEKMPFSCKAHTALDIFRFAVLFLEAHASQYLG